MNKIAMALIAAASLSLAAPAVAAISDSGSVGRLNQWDRAPTTHHQPAPHPAKTAHR